MRAPQNRSSRSDSLAPAHGRAGGGQGPFPREGVGDGETKRSRSGEPVTWPTAERSPHKSPSPMDGGAVGGVRWVRWRTRCPNLFGRPAQRRRPGELSSGGCRERRDTKRSDWRGVRAAAITSGVPGFRLPGLPAARLRVWRVTGGTVWRSGRDHSAAAGAARTPVRPAGSLLRSGKETEPAIPGHGTGPLPLVPPVNTGHAPPSPVPAYSALIKNKKLGPKAPGVTRGQARPCMWSATYMAECGLI